MADIITINQTAQAFAAATQLRPQDRHLPVDPSSCTAIVRALSLLNNRPRETPVPGLFHSSQPKQLLHHL